MIVARAVELHFPRDATVSSPLRYLRLQRRNSPMSVSTFDVNDTVASTNFFFLCSIKIEERRSFVLA